MALKYHLLEILVTSGNTTKANEILAKIIHVIEKNYWGSTLCQTLDVIKLVNCIAADNQQLLNTCI